MMFAVGRFSMYLTRVCPAPAQSQPCSPCDGRGGRVRDDAQPVRWRSRAQARAARVRHRLGRRLRRPRGRPRGGQGLRDHRRQHRRHGAAQRRPARARVAHPRLLRRLLVRVLGPRRPRARTVSTSRAPAGRAPTAAGIVPYELTQDPLGQAAGDLLRGRPRATACASSSSSAWPTPRRSSASTTWRAAPRSAGTTSPSCTGSSSATRRRCPRDHVRVTVHLPAGVTRDQVRAWAHGPLWGNVAIEPDASVVMTVDPLPAATFVEGRILFPAAALAKAKPTAGARLAAVLAEEKKLADQANRDRFWARVKVVVWSVVGFGFPLARPAPRRLCCTSSTAASPRRSSRPSTCATSRSHRCRRRSWASSGAWAASVATTRRPRCSTWSIARSSTSSASPSTRSACSARTTRSPTSSRSTTSASRSCCPTSGTWSRSCSTRSPRVRRWC